MSEWHLAQVNIARLHAPPDSPQLSGFVAMLDPINALAEQSHGFVWRLQTEDGDATSIRPFEDDRVIVNMSVWVSMETLGSFVYATRHLDVLRRRKEWFDRMAEAHLALWWVPAGTLPTVADAKERLAHLTRRGSSPRAFTFRAPFPPPGTGERVAPDDRWACPV